MNQIDKNKFWQYAYSNFLDNRNRGALAEYIVAEALGIRDSLPDSSWESYDLEYKGCKIEVKSSAYVQSWEQKKPSTPSWGIPVKQGWDGNTSDFDGVYARHADVYVFCLFTEQDRGLAKDRILNIEYWQFYIVPTSSIEAHPTIRSQKSVGIWSLQQLNATPIKFENLRKKIEACMVTDK